MTAPGTMTLAELQRLIADSKGEWEHIEFKKTTGELHGGMETLCGFLNGTGGKVLFGVTTAGKVVSQDVGDATFQEVANAIRKLAPPAWIEQARIPVDASKEVLMLEAAQQADGPYTFDGRAYQRIGNTTSRMPQHEYERRLLTRTKNQQRWGRGTQKIVELCRMAGQPEPDFEEQAGNVVVRFRLSQYTPPLRVSHDLTDRQRRILQLLSDGVKWKVQDILRRLENAPAKRTLQDDLSLLRNLGLIESGGRGAGARWWLKRGG